MIRPDLIRRGRAMARSRRTQLLRQRRSEGRSQRRPPEDASEGERAGTNTADWPGTAGHVGAMGAVIVLLAAVAGCSAGDTTAGSNAPEEQSGAEASPPEPPAASPVGEGGWARQRPEDASCPVTTPTSPAEVPPVLQRAGGSAWYGEDDLWVSLPRSPVTRGREGSYPIKWGSFTLYDGDVTSRYGPPETHARQLGGSETVEAGFGGYAHTVDTRFWPTGMEFPSPGCWVVTAALDDTEVRFVVRVGTVNGDARGQPPAAP